MVLLNGIAPGTGASQRIGMKIAIRSLEMRNNIYTNAAGMVAQSCRLLLLQDRQCNGAAPAALTDFISPGTYLGMRNLANRKRFRIIWDKTYNMGLAGLTDPQTVTRHIYLKFRKPLNVEYNAGVAGTVADISSNSLYLILVGNQAAGAADGDYIGQIRLRYTDM